MEGRAARRWREHHRLGGGGEVKLLEVGGGRCWVRGLEKKKKEKLRLFENLMIFSEKFSDSF